MSTVTSSANSSSRRRLKRTAMLLSAGLFAAALSIGGGVAANAVPPILNTTTATVNGSLTVTVSGFASAEALAVKLDATSPSLATGTADATGAYTTTVTIPAGTTLGIHAINVSGTASPTQTENVTIVAQPTVAPATASVTASAFGTTGVLLTFSGFTAGDSVQLGGGNGYSGGSFAAAPIIVGAAGTVSYTVHYSDFSTGTVVPGSYTVVAMTTNSAVSSAFAQITVGADPATPVKGNAHFTG